MKIRKAVVTAAGPDQRRLPIQTLIDRDGVEKSALAILVEEAAEAGVEKICVVVNPEDEFTYANALGDVEADVVFAPQSRPRGYGHAVFEAASFTAGEPFLHLVGDHLYVGRGGKSVAKRIVETAEARDASVSGARATRENQLARFGAVGAKRLPDAENLYRVTTVREKPTPTEAELDLVVPGMRAGYYLCFFGVHALSPAVMEILERRVVEAKYDEKIGFSPALAELADREEYLALELDDWRYDVGARYGVTVAQLALALGGDDRDYVLTQLLELLANRELDAPRGEKR
jgi:UTP--glucose-1-phosphate uridylyltransferase